MNAGEGTLLITARSFTAHCKVCGRAWSIPAALPDFDAQQRQVLDWFREHLSLVCARVSDTPAEGSTQPTRDEVARVIGEWVCHGSVMFPFASDYELADALIRRGWLGVSDTPNEGAG